MQRQTNIQYLEVKVKRLIDSNAVHRKSGAEMRTVTWDTVTKHLSDEVQEFRYEVLNGEKEKAIEELGDILGIVIHAAIKLDVSLERLSNCELAKLDLRFTLTK